MNIWNLGIMSPIVIGSDFKAFLFSFSGQFLSEFIYFDAMSISCDLRINLYELKRRREYEIVLNF